VGLAVNLAGSRLSPLLGWIREDAARKLFAFGGKGLDALRAKAATFLKRYHQTTDEYDPSWDLRGLVQQGQFIMNLGRRIADAPARPKMKR
jgi:hypothetical protein